MHSMTSLATEPQATRRPRLGESSAASGTRGVVRSLYAVEGRRKRGCGFGAAKEAAERSRCPCSRLPPQAGAGKRDSLNWFCYPKVSIAGAVHDAKDSFRADADLTLS